MLTGCCHAHVCTPRVHATRRPSLQPTTVQWIRLIAQAMRVPTDELEIVELPDEIAAPFRPLNQGENDGARGPCFFTNEKRRRLLGYRDVVGKREALRRTAEWMVGNRAKVAASAAVLQEPFNYESEDKLLAAWDRRDYAACLEIQSEFGGAGWGHFYYDVCRTVPPFDNLPGATQPQSTAMSSPPHAFVCRSSCCRKDGKPWR